MKTQQLGSGTEMPALGLGTWKSPADDVYRAVRTAVDVGYRHIDCAAVYGNEEAVGRALTDAFKAGHAPRDKVWVTSKLWNDSHAPERVGPALEESLRKLQLEFLDLYLIHWPVGLRRGAPFPPRPEDFVPFPELDLESTWSAMLELRDKGLAREVGVSNFSKQKIERLREATGRAPAVNQIELHPYLQQNALVDACRELGVAVTAYSPLGSPDSAAMFGRKDDVLLVAHPAIGAIATEHGATPGQVLIAWGLARGTSVIPKSTHPARIAENWSAQEVTLTPANLKAIEALDAKRRMIDGHLWLAGEGYSVQTLWDE